MPLSSSPRSPSDNAVTAEPRERRRTRPAWLTTALLALLLGACSSAEDTGSPAAAAAGSDSGQSADEVTEAVDAPGTEIERLSSEEGALTHRFGVVELEGFEEQEFCTSWTLENEQALYVSAVTLSNEGAFHHSNWFAVPEDLYAGPDGYFPCAERDFEQVASALAGTVLFAQSTQARSETQQLPEGVVVKIPPRHRIVAGVHLLNLSPDPTTTNLRMTLDVIHPRQVETVVGAINLGYWDLHIPASTQSYHETACDMATPYEQMSGEPMDMKLYYVLPHYHALGNYFRLEINGGERDGELLFEFSGFNAEANGVAFDPPVDLSGTRGLRLTCGFYNPRNEEVQWGIGDQEMCEFLALADTKVLMQGGATDHDPEVIEKNGSPSFDSECGVTGFPKNEAQALPSDEELDAPLYIPATQAKDLNLNPVPACVDHPGDSMRAGPATLDAISASIFKPTCTFSSCHDSEAPAAGLRLDIDGETLREALVDRASQLAEGELLVKPGAPAESVLFRMLSECEPSSDAGDALPAMPINAPTLLPDASIAQLRAWIEAGAAE